jgi:uncharacterized membrane protein
MIGATVVVLAASALMAGLFFAFSTFTMGGLRAIPARDGLAAMQGINRAAPRSPLFLTVFLGGALLSVVLGVIAASRIDDAGAPYLLVGSILNVVGVVVTAMFHVPRNDALAEIEPASAGAERAWSEYARAWTRGNHVRTLAYLASTVAFALALTEA